MLEQFKISLRQDRLTMIAQSHSPLQFVTFNMFAVELLSSIGNMIFMTFSYVLCIRQGLRNLMV